MLKRLQTLGAVLIALAIALPAAAQEQRAAIYGTVADSTGGVIPGASIEAKSLAGTITTVSDSAGKYRFPALRPGRWAINAMLSGFAPATVQSVELSLGDNLKVDLTLGPISVKEAVTVRGEAPLIDTKSAARYSTISADQIERIPKGRDFTSLATQAPGANYETKAGSGVSIDGATVSENRYIIDGLDTGSVVNGTQGKALITDVIEEVQVKSSGYAAEYGGSTGGVINVLTKSGSNVFKGDVGAYYTGSATGVAIEPGNNSSNTATKSYADGRNTLRLDPHAAGLVPQYIAYPKDSYSRVEPGVQLGGPILTDKMWFYGAYMPAIISESRSVVTSAGPTVKATQDSKVQYITANLTSQISNNTRLRLSFNNSGSTQNGILPALSGLEPPTTNYGINTTFPNWTASGNLDVVASNSLYFGLRGGYFKSDTHQTGVPTVPRDIFLFSNLGLLDVPANLQHGNGFANVPTNTATSFDTQTRLSGQFDSTYYFQAGGDHAVKLGVQFDRLGENLLSGEQNNRVEFAWDKSLNGQRGTYGYYEVRSCCAAFPKAGFSVAGNQHEDNVGLFLQDTWTIANRFTLNLGLRTENENLPSFKSGPDIVPTPIKFSFSQKLAPRLGLAWDPAGDGKTKVYGSWGYFYGTIPLHLSQDSFGGSNWLEYYYTLDTFNWPTITDAAGCPPACPGTLIKGPVNFRLPSNIVGTVPPGVDPNIKPYKMQEYGFGFERELAPAMSVGLRYIHKNLISIIEDIGSLDSQGNELYSEGNPGFGIKAICGDPAAGTADRLVPCPKATRIYDGVEASFNKRFAENWALRVSYLWSRLWGNYSGYDNSDENGRTDPNDNRAFDFPIMAFLQTGKPSMGVLATDRTHQIKFSGIYVLPFGTTIGLGEFVSSGIPTTTEAAVLPPNLYPIQFAGRNDAGRTPWFFQTDMNLAQSIPMGPVTMTLSVNVLNLFDQHIATNRFNTLTASGQGICLAPDLSPGAKKGACQGENANLTAFYNGFDAKALIAAQGLVTDPRYLMNSEFQQPRTVRFGARFAF